MTDRWGGSPLDEAIRKDQTEVIDYLKSLPQSQPGELYVCHSVCVHFRYTVILGLMFEVLIHEHIILFSVHQVRLHAV